MPTRRSCRPAGAADVVTVDVAARLVPPDDPGAWSPAILEVLDDPGLARDEPIRAATEGAGADHVRSEVPQATVDLQQLDLASLASIEQFAKRVQSAYDGVDLLVNNAGVMAIPRSTTVDGFETQFGTNHLGHFALTGQLLDLIRDRDGSRIVTVSSNGHKAGWIRFDDLMGERRYSKWLAYTQSKLANLLFMFELQRRLERIGARTISVAAHPGWAATNLQAVGPQLSGNRLMGWASGLANDLFGQILIQTSGARQAPRRHRTRRQRRRVLRAVPAVREPRRTQARHGDVTGLRLDRRRKVVVGLRGAHRHPLPVTGWWAQTSS